MSTIKIKQVKSRIGAPADQKRTLDALGLRKLNRVVEHESTPSILGSRFLFMMNINLIHFLYELSDCFTELSSHLHL